MRYIGNGYEEVGECSGLAIKSIRGSVNPGLVKPLSGTFAANILKDPGLRPLGGDLAQAGDVMAWGVRHIGFYDPNPPLPGQTVAENVATPLQKRSLQCINEARDRPA
jgi:hypothetical protein